MKALTARQQECLEIIRASIEREGYPPTLREIGVRMGIRSTNGVNDHLRYLEKKGFLIRSAGLLSRGIRLTGKSEDVENQFVLADEQEQLLRERSDLRQKISVIDRRLEDLEARLRVAS